jgi:hypothetical protein
MNETGDTRIRWDAARPDEVEAARAMFDTLRGKGYLAYSKRAGDRVQVRAFDPQAERIVMVPPIVGG